MSMFNKKKYFSIPLILHHFELRCKSFYNQICEMSRTKYNTFNKMNKNDNITKNICCIRWDKYQIKSVLNTF